MLFSELSPELKSLATQRWQEYKNRNSMTAGVRLLKSIDDVDVCSMFDWVKTKEGFDFWNKVNNNEIERSNPFYPKTDHVINDFQIF